MNKVHGGDIENAKEKFNREDFIDFSSNINPLGPPVLPKIGMEDIIHYPSPDYKKLKSIISDFFCISKDKIVLGNGATEIIYSIGRNFKNFVIFHPTFTEYKRAVKKSIDIIIPIDIEFDYEKKIKKFTNKTIFLCNPNNPTGHIIEKDKLIYLIKKYKDNIFVIDESYSFFSVKDIEVFRLVEEAKNLLVIKSFTKIFSIPGIRFGICFGNKEILEKLDFPLWNINSIAQKFIISIFSEDVSSFIKKTKEYISSVKKFFIKEIEKIPFLKASPSYTNFILLETSIPSSKIFEELGKKGILIRNCNDFIGLPKEKFIRISLRKKSEMLKLIIELKKIEKRIIKKQN